MEILRVPSNTIAYQVTGLEPGDYDYSVIDLADNSTITGTLTVDIAGEILSIPLPDSLDGEYEVSVADIVDIATVVRPYIDPNTLGTTASEIAEYTKYEAIARAIIDSYIGGFYNLKKVMEVNGSGSDYMPVWKEVNKVLQVYENNELVYDANAEDPDTNIYTFSLTTDRSAIVKVETGAANRITNPLIKLPASTGDIATATYNYGVFPEAYDYIFVVDAGCKALPTAVQRAAEILIDDVKCGRLDYFQKYITSYNTDQFKIQFDKKMLEGTGNLVVDKILDKYYRSINRVGVL